MKHDSFVTLRASQQGLDARLELGQFEGLGEIIVGPHVQALYAVVQASARSQDQHRRLATRAATGAQTLQDIETVHLGQRQIENDKRIVLGVQQRVGIGPVHRAFDLQTSVLQGLDDPARQFDMIFDEKYAHDELEVTVPCRTMKRIEIATVLSSMQGSTVAAWFFIILTFGAFAQTPHEAAAPGIESKSKDRLARMANIAERISLMRRFAVSIKLLLTVFLLAAPAFAATHAASAAAQPAECIVPSKPGGGFDLTCKLAQKGLQAVEQRPMRLSYLPGGIGAVAWNSIVTQRRNEPDTLVAFSGGSVLNIALGKFGKASIDDVRWVAALGSDYGMIAVRADSPYKNLRDLVQAFKRNPSSITIGAGGTIGSQDWIKIARLVKRDGIDPKQLHFVAFEGGGEAFTALLAGHVQVVSGDASEAVLHLSGKNPSPNIRVIAVLSDARLPGVLADVPTAHEQGYDVTWPIIRGFYMGSKVSNADYRRWVATFDRMMASKSFDQMRAAYGLYPFAMTGAALTEYIKKTAENYGKEIKELGLVR